MDLTLTVIESPTDTNMLNHTKAFRTEGGSFGRADNNNWVLPDNERVVSSRHAEITFKNGDYHLVDTSTNGTFINDEEDAIGQGNHRPLSNGDVISVGSYKLSVTIKNPQLPGKQGLPKGLEAADFLDSSDKTTFNPALQAKHEARAEAEGLDEWLEPGSATSTIQASDNANAWGTVDSASSVAISTQTSQLASHASPLQPIAADPLASFGQPASSFNHAPEHSAHVDPLAAMDLAEHKQPAPQAAWEDDDDWWKTGSEADHAPATSHIVQEQKPLEPVRQEPQSQPQAVQQASHEAAYQVQHQVQSQTQALQPQVQPITPEISPKIAPEIAPTVAPSNHTAPQPQPVYSANPEIAPTNIDHALGLGAMPQAQVPQAQVPPAHIAQPQQVTTQHDQHTLHTQAPYGQVPPHNHADSVSADSAALASSLGLSQLQAQQLAQLVPESAAIISETVNRLIDLLRARSSIKNELRVQRTMIQAADNNPLKFSATAPDALKAMFSADNQAFMRPQDAIRDSFDDLSDHQVAVLAGMRAAYDAMLHHFSPAKLEKRFNTSGSLLSNKKTKNWEAFEEYYAMLTRDGETTYNTLFGEEFATVYERQLAELKTARSLTSPGTPTGATPSFS